MSVRDHEETPEQRRLRLRIAQSLHNEEQVRLQREREAAGCKAWAAKHPGRNSLPIDRAAPARQATVHEYDVLAEFGLK